MEHHGSRGAAEKELLSRQQRHDELDVRPLDPRQRELYHEQWTHVQERFVDAPEAAVEQADRLVVAVMGERGYPTRDFEDRISHLSVAHGRTLDHYRRGRDISQRAAGKEASTEDLRQAMVHYRALFEDLLAVPEDERAPTSGQADTQHRDEPKDEQAAQVREAEAKQEEARKAEVREAEAREAETREAEAREAETREAETREDREVRAEQEERQAEKTPEARPAEQRNRRG